MPTIRIAIPLALALAAAYFGLPDNNFQHTLIGFFAIALVLLFFFQRQVDWWFYQKYPPKPDPKLQAILRATLPYYANLTPPDQARFDQRLSLFMLSKTFEAKGADSVPQDLQAFIAAMAVQLTFRLEAFLQPNFERVFIYPHLFPSPLFPFPHASEVFEDDTDGGFIFAADRTLLAIFQPHQAFNIALYEMANAHRIIYHINDYEIFDTPQNRQILQTVRRLPESDLLEYTQLPTLNFFARAVEHFFFNPKAFKLSLPELYDYLCQHLRQDPAESF